MAILKFFVAGQQGMEFSSFAGRFVADRRGFALAWRYWLLCLNASSPWKRWVTSGSNARLSWSFSTKCLHILAQRTFADLNALTLNSVGDPAVAVTAAELLLNDLKILSDMLSQRDGLIGLLSGELGNSSFDCSFSAAATRYRHSEGAPKLITETGDTYQSWGRA